VRSANNARARHHLTLPPACFATNARVEWTRRFAPVVRAFAPAGTLKPAATKSFAGESLPPSVQLLTTEPQPDGSLFVRLAHRFGANEAAGAPPFPPPTHTHTHTSHTHTHTNAHTHTHTPTHTTLTTPLVLLFFLSLSRFFLCFFFAFLSVVLSSGHIACPCAA
jgi:hypothetical protein